MIGRVLDHKLMGRGDEKILIMHDWFSDISSYDGILDYLDTNRYTYCFMNLRGYGGSKEIQGTCTAEEASQDAFALTDHLMWDRFHGVGHSMTGLVVQQMAVDHPERLKSVIAVTPVPATGAPVAEDVMSFLEDAARSNDASAEQIVHMMTGNRYQGAFIQFKISRWRMTSSAEARVAYLHMFAETDISNQVQGIEIPFLVIVGANDAEGHSVEVMERTFKKFYPHVEIKVIQDSGHYPMQETPPTLATLIEDFVGKHC